MKKVVAVVGTGSVGMRHLNALKHIDGILPIAVPVRVERCAQLEQEGFLVGEDIPTASKKGATYCIVATDTGRHVFDGLEALKHGMDLLVEKPIGSDASAASALYEGALAAGRMLYVGCVLRFSKSLNAFQNLLEQIGFVYSVSIECRSYLPEWRLARDYRQSYSARGEEGGVLRDLIHEIDYAGWMFGWPKHVQADVKNFGRLDIESEEMAKLWWETDQGVCVSLELDYLSRTSKRIMRAFGQNGVLEWNGVEGKVFLRLPSGAPQVFSFRQTRDEMFLRQAEAFLGCRESGASCQLSAAKEGVMALAICDAARLASKNRREERIHYPC